MFEVNREHMAELVADLRSGNFVQGRSVLAVTNETGTQFCCEGVGSKRACEALGLPIEVGDGGIWDFDSARTLASTTTAEFFGLETGNDAEYPGWIVRSKGADGDWKTEDCFVLNDTGVPFTIIADMIEAYYLNGGQQEFREWQQSFVS